MLVKYVLFLLWMLTEEQLYEVNLWSSLMSRNRFQLLLRFFHFVNNFVNSDDRLYKIRPIMDQFSNVLKKIYVPDKNLCIDESMMLWRGRLIFTQYIKNKKHKYGIKHKIKHKIWHKFGEIDSRENRSRARPGFVKPIRNGLRKVQNLIECRPSRAETGLAGRDNGIRFQKEEKTG